MSTYVSDLLFKKKSFYANIFAECCGAGGCQEICQLRLEGGGGAGTSQINKNLQEPASPCYCNTVFYVQSYRNMIKKMYFDLGLYR